MNTSILPKLVFFGTLFFLAENSYSAELPKDIMESLQRREKYKQELMDGGRSKRVADNQRTDYLERFSDIERAPTLFSIRDFEVRFKDNDPDGLIPRLSEIRKPLEYQEYRDLFAKADSSREFYRIVALYADNDPDNLVPDARKRAVELEIHDKQLEAQRNREAADEHKLKEREEARLEAQRAERMKNFLPGLKAKYGRDVSGSPGAMAIVSAFNIACPNSDRRAIPLLNLLYVIMAEVDGAGLRKKFRVDNRGNQVRIFASVSKNGSLVLGPELEYEISEWGELRPHGIRVEAILMTCYGSRGPIWITQ